MTTEYKLVAFSRDVNYGTSLGKHSGYGLVKYENGVPVAMKSVEVTASSAFGNMNFASSNDLASGYSDGWIPVNSSLSTNGNIVPEKTFENGQWQETTSDWVSDRGYKTVPLKDSNGNDFGEPTDAYRQIENVADYLNQSGISYDPANQNCNTWVGYIDGTILGDVGVFDQLNENLDNPEIYLGGGLPFPFPGSEMYLPNFADIPGAIMDYLKDKKILENMKDIQAYLDSKGLYFRDVKCTMYMTLNNICCVITYQMTETIFATPIPRADSRPFTPLKENKETAEITPSPLIVDLDGDGVETTGTQSGTHFDHDGNGFAENTGWVGKDDGILVRDINGNGEIDNGTELFGNNSVLSNGEKAANGFEALKDLDSNNDGVFNNSDAAWNEVKVWKDSNGNGILDDGELLTLEQAGIAGINLGYNNQNIIDANGNQHSQTGSFIKSDGTSGTISDVWFDDDKMNTVDKSGVVIPDAIKTMPEVAGFGNVHSLQAAMALDETGELKALVEQYAAETDPEARDAILINLIYHWTGVQDMDPEGRNPTQVYGNVLGDSRKLEALEEFWGEEFLGTWCWGERDPNLHGKAAPYILQAFDDLKDYIKNQLNAQTHYKDILEAVTLTYNETTQTWEADASAAVELLRNKYEANPVNGMEMLREFSAIVAGYKSFADTVINAFHSFGKMDGTIFENELLSFGQWENIGTAGNDTIRGTDVADYINGYAGNDRLYGGDGNDILVGGEGDDYLVGGEGNDTYRFEAGFGNDSLDNSQDDTIANQDVVEFGEDILKENVTMDRQGYDLIIKVSYPQVEGEPKRPDDTLRIFSYFDKQGTTSATVSQIKFADGTVWDYDYVIDNWNSMPSAGGGIIVEGGNGNDTIYGSDYNDILIGNDGNDTFYGKSGNDTFIGGKGNDYYDGNYGDDTFIWNWGDGLDTIGDGAGHDKIIFGIGISFSDLTFEAVPNGGGSCTDLKIIVKGNSTQGIIINNYMNNIDFRIEELKFADGSRIHLSEIPLSLHQSNNDGQQIQLTHNGDTVYAGNGNDVITGGNGDDTLTGGIGDDYLNGGNGDDTYVWNLGDGFDRINDNGNSSDTNVIRFGEGINKSDLTFREDNGSLVVIVKGNETQGFYIQNHFSNQSYNKINRIDFADGTSLNLLTDGLTLEQSSGQSSVTGTNGNDIIHGNTGNDSLSGGNGNDIITGNGGNDSLYGSSGDDTLTGGIGDDYLNGGNGDDTYIWNLGDGFDRINDDGGNDTLKFGEGITADDLNFYKDNGSLIVTVKGDKTQGMRINNFTSNGRIETAEFADGSTLDLTNADLLVQAMSTFGADGSNGIDTLSSDPTASVHEMYSLACSSDLNKRAA